MCRIILCKPQREEDKLIDHEEERRQTHPDITNMISPVLTHISLKFYYRKYMLRKKNHREIFRFNYGYNAAIFLYLQMVDCHQNRVQLE